MNERIERVLEIQRRIDRLGDNDRLVLNELPFGEKTPVLISLNTTCEVSAKLYILPREVEEALGNLQELGLLSEVRKKRTNEIVGYVVNENGCDAQVLLKLGE